jgi:hypothetical protein
VRLASNHGLLAWGAAHARRHHQAHDVANFQDAFVSDLDTSKISVSSGAGLAALRPPPGGNRRESPAADVDRAMTERARDRPSRIACALLGVGP